MRLNTQTYRTHEYRLNPSVTYTILPGLKAVPLGKLMRATGLSKRYLWLIRRGDFVPHPRHWDALRSVAFRS